MKLSKIFFHAILIFLNVCTEPEVDPEIQLSPEWQTELTWTWIENDRMISRTGLTSGYGINLNSNSDKLLIYLQGGGACFNEETCADNPFKFDEADFNYSFVEPGWTAKYASIFDRENSSNPFSGWNLLFVPYTTGDTHAGNKQAVDVPFGGPVNQQMVGFNNISVLLAEAAPILLQKGINEVFLCGSSAGGFGTIFNYDQVAQSFPQINISMLVDAGQIFLNEDINPSCLSSLLEVTWDIQIPKDYALYVEGTYNSQMQGMYEYLSKKYPDAQFGFYSSYYDEILRYYYGFGKNNCAHVVDTIDAQIFKAGLLELAQKFNELGNWKAFYNESTVHTILLRHEFNTLSISNTKFSDWVDQLNTKTAQNVME